MIEPWFSVPVAAVFGPVLGLFGVLFGVLSSRPGGGASARPVATLAAIYSYALFVAGLIAISLDQPSYVWFSLLVVGGIGSSLFGWCGLLQPARPTTEPA